MNPEMGKYIYCFVPLCPNTTHSAPGKLFISVPREKTRRDIWMAAVRRDSTVRISLKTKFYCCQDHFNLEEDFENYLQFKLMGGLLRTKKDVVPHIFDCHPESSADLLRFLPPKLSYKVLDDSFLKVCSNSPVVTAAQGHRDEYHKQNYPVAHCSKENVEFIESVTPLTTASPRTQPSPSLQTPPIPRTSKSTIHLPVVTRTVPSQTEINVRSAASQCSQAQLGVLISTKTSPMKMSPKKCDAKLSPIKIKRSNLDVDVVFSDSSSREQTDQSSSVSKSDVDSSDDVELAQNSEAEEMRRISLLRTRYYCKTKSRMYIGIPQDSLYVVDILSHRISYSSMWLTTEDVIFLILKKIRLNDTFSILGDDFGISTSQASKIFSQFLPILSFNLKELIVWPKKEVVHRLLPVAFKARYSNVQSIIDCFEIEIEKPSAAVVQSLSWSEYKKGNTIKYLVSCTPNGVVNFVSRGFGGRVTDMTLLENSGYLDKLSPNLEVMADRGFKQIESSINARGCTLVRPPSVSEGVKLDAAAVQETKRIASLRIHIERIIRRFREFKFLEPHACSDIHVIDVMDYCVLVVAGLINLQGSYIK